MSTPIETADKSPSRLQHMPISMFAMVMGCTGLSLGWQKAAHTLGAPALIHQLILIGAALLMLLLTFGYLLKLVRYPRNVREEFEHPIKISFFPAFSISLLLFSIATLESAPYVSRLLWIIGAAMHLTFTVHVMNQWIHHTKFRIAHSTPAWFIPVVGNILVPISGMQHGFVEASWFFFSIGLLYWLILKTLIFNRILFHDPLPAKLLPTLFILIAPPAVGFISWQQLNGGQFDALSHLLYYTTLFLALLLFIQWKRFIRIPFFVSWWAYSFPLAAFSIATQIVYRLHGGVFYYLLSWVSLVLVSTVILLLLVRTLRAAADGSLFQPD